MDAPYSLLDIEGYSNLIFITNDYKQDILFKSILIGDHGVGKTSLCNSLKLQRFRNIYRPTVKVDFFTFRIFL